MIFSGGTGEPKVAVAATVIRERSLKLVSQGLLTQLANPKAIVFFTALLPQFVSPGGLVLAQFLLLGVVSIAVEFPVLVGCRDLRRFTFCALQVCKSVHCLPQSFVCSESVDLRRANIGMAQQGGNVESIHPRLSKPCCPSASKIVEPTVFDSSLVIRRRKGPLRKYGVLQ
jgi:hypothetical protein